MVKNFHELFQAWNKLGVILPDSDISNSKAISTNRGLYTVLTTYISEIIQALDSIKDLGAEIGSEDEASAKVSARQFLNILHGQSMQELKNSHNRKYYHQVFNQLNGSQYLFYQVADRPNHAYHNKYCYPVIIKTADGIHYSDDSDLQEYAIDKSNAIGDNSPYEKLDLRMMHKQKPTIERILRQKYHTTQCQLKLNPKASDYLDKPRYIQINDTKIFYNPKVVSKNVIIRSNIPNLPNDSTMYGAEDYDKEHHSLLQY